MRRKGARIIAHRRYLALRWRRWREYIATKYQREMNIMSNELDQKIKKMSELTNVLSEYNQVSRRPPLPSLHKALTLLFE